MKSSYRDLTEYIDISRVKALNITKESNPTYLFQKCLNVIESRADPQILLMISCIDSFLLLNYIFHSKSP